MFQNEMEDLEESALLDDSATLEPINYEAELKKFDEKLSYKFESFYLRCLGEQADKRHDEEAEPGNMLETLRMKIRLLGEDSKLVKKKQDEVSKGTEEHAKIKQEVDKLTGEAGAQAKTVSDITKSIGHKEQKLRAGMLERVSQSSVVEDKTKKVTAELSAYQQTLGLELHPSNRGGTLLIFSNIHRDHPERKFSLELIVGEREMFFFLSLLQQKLTL